MTPDLGAGVAAPCELLAWDSEFFGVRIARVTAERLDEREADAALAWCRANGVACLYFLAPSSDRPSVRAAERRGFALVDIRIDLGCRLEDGAPAEPADAARPARPQDADALLPIAREGFGLTRFSFDERFRPERAGALYETWLRRSLDGDLADVVLVLDATGGPCAFVTCQLSATGEGRIGLLGVASTAQGAGGGRRLCLSALAWFARKGASSVTVTTQGRNLGALRLYGRCGFVPERVSLWYHRWFDSPGE